MLVVVGTIPAILALFVFFYVKDIKEEHIDNDLRKDVTVNSNALNEDKKSTKRIELNNKFILFLVIIFIFTLGNSSDAFLILKAQSAGNCVLDILINADSF